ncbi:MobA/MobL family protein [Brasilonema sp. CT11]|nr:MobA/MobL family protein [Brasilonema sp. CT11]
MQEGYYRLEAKVISRAKGHSATAAAAYRAGTIIKDVHTGIVYDFSRKKDVFLSEIHAPEDAPEWVYNRSQLWNAVEEIEWTDNRKKNTARLARDITICFPEQMSHEHKLEAARSLMKEFTNLGMIGDISYHDFTGKNEHNPHAHIMLSLRELKGDKFVKKNRNWDKNELLESWRERWCHHQNVVLEKYGYDIRVDHRSYKAQGIERVPTLHEGKEVSALRRKGQKTNKSRRNDEIKQLNQELETAKEHLRQEQIRDAWREKEREERIEARSRLVEELNLDSKPEQTRELEIRHLSEISHSAIAPTITVKAKDNGLDTSSLSDMDQEREERSPLPPKIRQYYSYHIIKQQLDAMGGDGRFEIGLLNRRLELNEETGELVPRQHPMKTRTFKKEDILRYDSQTGRTPIVSWLRHQNAQGKDIFIRLAPTADGKQQGLILVDDIDPMKISELKARGLEFAVVMETSPKNCQGLVRVSQEPIERETATQLAKMLTQAVGGDSGSAGFQHYSRLSGLTNRKNEHVGVYQGKYGFPYVKLLEASGKPMRNGAQWVEKAREQAALIQQQEQEALKLVGTIQDRPATDDEKQRALQVFQQIFAKARREHNNRDLSSIDWATLKRMAKRGWGADALRYALEHGSENLEQRKPGHVADYVTRSVANVFKNQEVLMAIAKRQERAIARSTGTESQQPSAKIKSHQQSEIKLDQRETIEQWQEYKNRERSKLTAQPQERLAQYPEGDGGSSSGRSQQQTYHKSQHYTTDRTVDASKEVPKPSRSPLGRNVPLYHNSYYRWLQAQKIVHQPKEAKIDPANTNYLPADIKAEAVGELDAETVRTIITAARNSKNASEQLRKAEWALGQDTTKWRSQAKAEYLRELGRMVHIHGKEAVLDPNTDIEIAIKLRIAGFSFNQIYTTIREQSPVSTSLPSSEHQFTYLNKALKPYLQTSQTRTLAYNFQYERRRTAQAIADPALQQAHLNETRLDKLGLATQLEHHNEPSHLQQERKHPSVSSPSVQHSFEQHSPRNDNFERGR